MNQPNVVTKVKETDILPRHIMLKSTHGEKRGQKNQELTLGYTLMRESGCTVWGPCVLPSQKVIWNTQALEPDFGGGILVLPPPAV